MFSKESKKTIGVVFDMGTASVSATLYERDVSGRPSVITTMRRFQKTPFQSDEARFSKSSISLFSELLKNIIAASKDHGVPREYCVGLSSVFYLSKTHRVYQKKPIAQKITSAILNDLIDREKQKFLASIGRENMFIFESSYMKTMLNGYDVESPVGKWAEELELFVYFAATSKELYDALLAPIKAVSAGATLRLATFPLATKMIMHSLLFPEPAVLLVDIGGEVTEITFLKNNVIVEVLALPFGVLNVLTRVSGAFGVDMENALSLLKAYTSGRLDENILRQLQAVIKPEMKNWEQNFERVWSLAAHHAMSRINMFFLGGGSLVADMRNALIPPLLHPEMASGLRASIVAPDAFRDKFIKYDAFDGPGDFGLMSLILQS